MTASVTSRELRVGNVLKELGLNSIECGASDGRGWFAPLGARLDSYGPTTGERIGQIYTATETEYQAILGRLQKRFSEWREVPAPKRAELIRDVGVRLNEMIEPISELIAIEMGKTANEARGEVLEG